MRIAAVCCTYLRPRQLGCLIQCFLKQDYPPEKRELVILDDAGQYEDQAGSGWRLISQSKRYPTLGQKRNAAARLVSPDVKALAVWDDDDVYLPWALSGSVAALADADWSRPSVVLHKSPGGLVQRRTWNRADQQDKAYQGGWALRSEAFWRVGAYPAASTNEDLLLSRRLRKANVRQADPIALGVRPFYVWGPHGNAHLSGWPVATGYRSWGKWSGNRTTLTPTDPPGIDLDNPRILPGVQPRAFGGDWS